MINNYIHKVQLMARCTYNNGHVDFENFNRYYNSSKAKAKC